MFAKLPPVTRALLVANVVLFLVFLMPGRAVAQLYEFLSLQSLGTGGTLSGTSFYPWQLISYAFLHDRNAPWHLIFNMLALVMFGAQVEYHWGARRFSTYYFTTVVGAAITQLAFAFTSVQMGGEPYSTVGASGGIFGLLLAYGMLFPHQRVMLLIPPVPMKARTLVIVYGVVELFMGITGTMPGVAHFAHLGGMLFGWLLIRHWRRRPPTRGGRGPRPRMRIVS